MGGFGRTSYAFASAATIGEALRVFCRDSQRGVVGLTAQLDSRLVSASFRIRSGYLAADSSTRSWRTANSAAAVRVVTWSFP